MEGKKHPRYASGTSLGKQIVIFSYNAIKRRVMVHATTRTYLDKVMLNYSSHVQRNPCLIHFCKCPDQANPERQGAYWDAGKEE